MARRSDVNTVDGFTIEPARYNAMTGAMMELAMRDGKSEALVMRIAKAGNITEVTKQLTRLRVYAKKQGLVRAKKEPRVTDISSGKGKGTKKKSRRGSPGGESNSGGEAA